MASNYSLFTLKPTDQENRTSFWNSRLIQIEKNLSMILRIYIVFYIITLLNAVVFGRRNHVVQAYNNTFFLLGLSAITGLMKCCKQKFVYSIPCLFFFMKVLEIAS